MKKSLILAIDQGTTGTRAILYDEFGRVQSSSYSEFNQYYPQPGWVEHDAVEIWRTTRQVITQAIRSCAKFSKIVAIGITNQRETTVLWNPKTGKPYGPAIVWQDRRTSEFCSNMAKQCGMHYIRQKTGLTLDPYFSASKISWLLKKYNLFARAKDGEVYFGTMDTWLLWNLTSADVHATDFTNASRTLLFNINKLFWDEDLLRLFKVPKNILPSVKSSGANFGTTKGHSWLASGIPIFSLIGDQQAALFGQGCYKKSQVKNTYGTGCFAVMNIGKRNVKPPVGLITTLACDEYGKVAYALEGSVFIAGAAIQWLRDGLRFFKRASETEKLISQIKDSGGVTFIPALSGLGSPHWNPNVRGMISGLTRGTTYHHIIRAALEAVAHQTADVIEAMHKSSTSPIHEFRVDGGMTKNRFLMQYQSDILQIPVLASAVSEATAWGAAKLAGYGCGVYSNLHKLDTQARFTKYSPKISSSQAKQLRCKWKNEVHKLIQSQDNLPA